MLPLPAQVELSMPQAPNCTASACSVVSDFSVQAQRACNSTAFAFQNVVCQV